MSDLSHKFNLVWAKMGGTKNANITRVFMEVRRIMTGKPAGSRITPWGGSVPIDRARDFTAWELRLAELVVERMRNGPVLPK